MGIHGMKFRLSKKNQTLNYCLILFLLLLPVHLISQTIEKIWIEAEQGQIQKPFKVFSDNNASAGQFIEVIPGNNSEKIPPSNGICSYTFEVKNSGRFKVWGHVIAPMHDEDAFWVRIDNGPWIPWKGVEVGCKWHWDAVHDHAKNDQEVIFELSKGKHTFSVTYFLDGTRLDKLLITNDTQFVPVNKGLFVNAKFKVNPKKPVILNSIKLDGSNSESDFGKIVNYEWDFGDGQKAEGINVEHIFKNSGIYEIVLKVTDEYGNSGIYTKRLEIYSTQPVANFEYWPERPKPNTSVTFDASLSLDADGKITQYKWDFGDGITGQGKKVTHSYKTEGLFKPSLTVVDNDGQKKTVTKTIFVSRPRIKKVIYETDMCLDVDDVGGLALLHALENKGEAEMLAVCFNEAHPDGAAAIDAINTWYGRGDIPVGIYKGELADPDYSAYLTALAKFPHDLDGTNAPSALNVYRQVLAKQPDKSVTIISIGFLNNLSDLLNAYPQLVKKKVKELVIMAGIHNDGFNLVRHNLVNASQNVLENWPTPIVISQAGVSIHTGSILENTPQENPVREAYYQFFNSQFCDRSSWDEMAVLYGVRGLSNYFSEVTEGYGMLNDGYRWKMQKGFRVYLENKLPDSEYKKIIEQLMIEPPKGE